MPHEHIRTKLCIGGPLDRKQFEARSNQNHFVYTISDDLPIDPSKSGITISTTTEQTEYREQSFHTPDATITFWAPSYQSPKETLTKLYTAYSAKDTGMSKRRLGYEETDGDN